MSQSAWAPPAKSRCGRLPAVITILSPTRLQEDGRDMRQLETENVAECQEQRVEDVENSNSAHNLS